VAAPQPAVGGSMGFPKGPGPLAYAMAKRLWLVG